MHTIGRRKMEILMIWKKRLTKKMSSHPISTTVAKGLQVPLGWLKYGSVRYIMLFISQITSSSISLNVPLFFFYFS